MTALNMPLNDNEIDELDQFLFERLPEQVVEEAGPEVDEGLLNISELDGFLTAIVSSPQAIALSDWLPLVWGDIEPVWGSVDSSERVMSLIIRHMNGIVNTLMQEPGSFEPIVLTRTVEERKVTVVDDWCMGYMKGVSLSADAWRAAGEEAMELLFPIMVFTTQEGHARLDELDADEVVALQQAIPDAVREIHAYWLQQRMPQPFIHDAPPVGRNDPCPCGSGKKFKKCCLH